MRKLIAVALMIAMPATAVAKGHIVARPMQIGDQSVRYRQGVATVEAITPDTTIDITPLGFDHGGLTFGIAVFNAAEKPANLDVTDIAVRTDTEDLRVLTADELIRKAKNRAMWTQIALATAAGLAAGAAASQRDYYHGSMATPHGMYMWNYSAPSAAGQVAAAASVAGGAYGIVKVQQQLDQTVAGIGDRALQLSTIMPGESYAAKFVLTKAKKSKWPQILHMNVTWNGKRYQFDFDVGDERRPAPKFVDVHVPDAIGASIPSQIPSQEPQPITVPATAPADAVSTTLLLTSVNTG